MSCYFLFSTLACLQLWRCFLYLLSLLYNDKSWCSGQRLPIFTSWNRSVFAVVHPSMAVPSRHALIIYADGAVNSDKAIEMVANVSIVKLTRLAVHLIIKHLFQFLFFRSYQNVQFLMDIYVAFFNFIFSLIMHVSSAFMREFLEVSCVA